MKNTFLLLVLILLCGRSYSQNPSPYDYQNVFYYINKAEYYGAVKQLDAVISKYPKSGEMYFYRGLVKHYMNDIVASKVDLMQSQKLGYTENAGFVKWATSTAFKVKILSKPYQKKNTLEAKNGYKPVYGRKDSLQGALRPERTCFDVYFYNLTVKILPKSKSIEGCNLIYFKTIHETKKIQIDLSDKLKITSITWNGKNLKYTRSYNAIFIDFGETLPAGTNQMITVSYEGSPRVSPSPPWNGGFVWKKNLGNWWVGVACEHLGASSWWPCKDHLTEKPDSMCINIRVPEGYQAVANGNLRSSSATDDHYTNFEWFVSYPINSYCVTFYMGMFVNFNETYTNANGSYKMDYYVLQQHLDSAKAYYSQTKDIVKVYEKLYGEYPYKNDGLAMVEAPYAGMEHQSAIAIGDEYGTKKRRDYDVIDYDYLLVHETAHEWWGNTVTMGDMADAWISESFATYSEHLFMEEKYGYDQYLKVVSKGMESIENIWPCVGVREVNDNSFIGGDIYNKGAAMLHNLRCTLNNDTLFFEVIKGFYTTYKFRIATTSDFINYVNTATGKDFTDFFTKFLYDAKPPVLEYSYTLKKDSLVFTYKWVEVGNKFTMPFGIMLNGYKSIRLEGTPEAQTFTAPDIETFYIPNEKRFIRNDFARNSYTYFWTSWKQ